MSTETMERNLSTERINRTKEKKLKVFSLTFNISSTF